MKISTKLIAAFFTGVYLVACTSQTAPPVKTDWEKENLKGNVKSISEYSTELDSLGNVLDSAGWNKPDVQAQNVYLYNTSGFRTDWIMFDSVNGSRKQVYTYNSSNRLKKVEYFSTQDPKKFITTYTYSKSGRLISIKDEMTYDDGDGLKNRFTLRKAQKYDANGYVIKSIAETEEKESDYYITYEFDSRGNKIKEEHFKTNGEWVSSYEYVYDSDDKKILERSKTKFSDMEEKKYMYDGNGNLLSMSIELKDGNKTYPFKITYVYVYDKLGNWIKRLTLNNGVKESIDKRVIEYY